MILLRRVRSFTGTGRPDRALCYRLPLGGLAHAPYPLKTFRNPGSDRNGTEAHREGHGERPALRRSLRVNLRGIGGTIRGHARISPTRRAKINVRYDRTIFRMPIPTIGEMRGVAGVSSGSRECSLSTTSRVTIDEHPLENLW